MRPVWPWRAEWHLPSAVVEGAFVGEGGDQAGYAATILELVAGELDPGTGGADPGTASGLPEPPAVAGIDWRVGRALEGAPDQPLETAVGSVAGRDVTLLSRDGSAQGAIYAAGDTIYLLSRMDELLAGTVEQLP